MLLQHARASARTATPTATLVPLEEQDRAAWDRAAIDAGLAAAAPGSASRARSGPYQLQALIAACHATAPTADGHRLGQDRRACTTSSWRCCRRPPCRLNRAVAIAMALGPAGRVSTPWPATPDHPLRPGRPRRSAAPARSADRGRRRVPGGARRARPTRPSGPTSRAGCAPEAYCRGMGPARRMQQVEVVDDGHLIAAADGPGLPGAPVVWVAVLLVVTLVLVGAQLVLAARDRAVSARFAQLPGALPPVEADVGALWRVDEADLEVLTEGVEVDGARCRGAHRRRRGAGRGALDPRTGADRWTTPLSDADPVLAQRGAPSSVTSCAPVPERRHRPSRWSRAWCPTRSLSIGIRGG